MEGRPRKEHSLGEEVFDRKLYNRESSFELGSSDNIFGKKLFDWHTKSMEAEKRAAAFMEEYEDDEDDDFDEEEFLRQNDGYTSFEQKMCEDAVKREMKRIQNTLIVMAQKNKPLFLYLLRKAMNSGDNALSIAMDMPRPKKRKRGAGLFEQLFDGLEERIYKEYKKGNPAISSEQLRKSIVAYNEKMNKHFDTLRSEIQEISVATSKTLIDHLDSLDLGIDTKEVQRRLESIDYNINDPVVRRLAEVWGSYDPHTHRVWISADISKTNKRHTVLHEQLHAVSGLSEIVYENEEFDEMDTHEETRLGLSFMKNYTKASFIWLNEAVTEQLTLDATQIESSIYKEERALLEELIKKVPKEHFIKAYFENYSVKEKGEHRTPHLKDLFVRMNEAYGKGALIKLNAVIDSLTKAKKSKKKALQEVVTALRSGTSIDDLHKIIT